MSGHCHVCGTPGCNGSCNEMRGLSVREQAERINEEALGLIKAVMQKQTSAMLEAMEEKVAELKRDSERYIWLIIQESWEPPRDALPEWYGGKIKWLGGDYSIDEINEIIDEARKHEHTNP